MKDFETLPIGSITEIRLSRALANEVDRALKEFGPGSVPENVQKAYLQLFHHYQKQMDMESY